jgi:hypothetical protein
MKKQKRGVVSPAQQQWIETLNTVPNVQAYVCYGSDEAIAVVIRLMGKSLTVTAPAESDSLF